MKRKVIFIDEDKCIGCGICVNTCHEGVIEIINNKATLVREDHCDGLGNCLPNCPSDAIRMVEKEVENNKVEEQNLNWPIQLKLIPEIKGIFNESVLYIAADCTAFRYKDFYNEFSDNKKLVIACPKLDGYDYSTKINKLILNNKINNINLVLMEVPCCRGLERMLDISVADIPWTVEIKITVIGIDGRKK